MTTALHRIVVVLLVTAAAVALCAAPTPAAPAGNTEDGSALTSRVEAERAGAQLPAYVIASDLVTVARRHAQRMADRGEHYHNPNLATEVSGWTLLGENVGQGYTVDDVDRAFMESSEHRSNILSRRFSQVGVGVVRSADGRVFVVEVFREPMPASPPRAPVLAARAPAPAPTPRPTPARPPSTSPTPAPPVESVLSAAIAPAAKAVKASLVMPSPTRASLVTPAPPMPSLPRPSAGSIGGPATVAALLIAAVLVALVGTRRHGLL